MSDKRVIEREAVREQRERRCEFSTRQFVSSESASASSARRSVSRFKVKMVVRESDSITRMRSFCRVNEQGIA